MFRAAPAETQVSTEWPYAGDRRMQDSGLLTSLSNAAINFVIRPGGSAVVGCAKIEIPTVRPTNPFRKKVKLP